jgi:hypothetical protein
VISLRVSALAIALVSCIVATRANASPFDLAGQDWEGCGELVQLAQVELGGGAVGAARVVVTKRLDMHEVKREDAIVILHPERTLDTDSLASFMRHGGRVILLDDYGTGDRLLAHFGIQRVPAPERPVESLRGNPQFAIAEPASNHPVVHDVSRVVTNHATGVKHPDLSPVLKIRSADGNDVLLAEAGAVGQGRFLAVGDASIVINSMMRYPGNRAFARALVRYATDDDTWGKRGGRLFLVSGDFEQKGAFGDDSALGEEMAEWRRSALDALEKMRREGMPPGAAYLLAVAIGLAIVIWVGARAGKTHRASTPRFVRKLPVALQGGVAGHAAVVGAPSTSRVLAMLELKSALEEDLCGLLDLDHAPGVDELVTRAAKAGVLDAEGLRALKRLLLRMANVEMLALSKQSGALERVRDREIVAVSREAKELLRQAHAKRAIGEVA